MKFDLEKIFNKNIRDLIDAYSHKKPKIYFTYEGEMERLLLNLKQYLSNSDSILFHKFLEAQENYFYELLEDIITFCLETHKKS